MKFNKISLKSVLVGAALIILVGSGQSLAVAQSPSLLIGDHQSSLIRTSGNLQDNRTTSNSSSPGSEAKLIFSIPLATPYQYFLPAVANQSSKDPVVFAAGDIAECPPVGDAQTAALLGRVRATILPLGDNAYESGTLDEYNQCYGPTWGQYKAETFPSVGNHEYLTPGASGYFQYFGAAAGDPNKGYYSYNLGTWHIIVLNSNCVQVGGCDQGSPQLQWLQADLAANPTTCTLAYWHHPRFSSGENGNDTYVSPFWQVLYQAGAEVILNGHDHDYERFAPQNPNGGSDPAQGITEFVVGTGGKNLGSITTTIANSVIHDDTTFGVLELVLYPSSYYWQFVPVNGETFTDSGIGQCH